jgi:hypothetical protein
MSFSKRTSVRPNLSAGILGYRAGRHGIEVLLVHPGGPYWRNKDDGAWSIPKGEIGISEDAEQAARRRIPLEEPRIGRRRARRGSRGRSPTEDLRIFAPGHVRAGDHPSRSAGRQRAFQTDPNPAICGRLALPGLPGRQGRSPIICSRGSTRCRCGRMRCGVRDRPSVMIGTGCHRCHFSGSASSPTCTAS